jgi:hypothetical protein
MHVVVCVCFLLYSCINAQLEDISTISIGHTDGSGYGHFHTTKRGGGRESITERLLEGSSRERAVRQWDGYWLVYYRNGGLAYCSASSAGEGPCDDLVYLQVHIQLGSCLNWVTEGAYEATSNILTPVESAVIA